MDSILTSIKKLLGITEEYEHFDTDLIIHINSVFMALTQIGVGPSEGFIIHDEDAIWSDFIQDPLKQQAVKTDVYLKVKLIFDPPLSSGAITAMNEQIKEYEWRLNISAETSKSE